MKEEKINMKKMWIIIAMVMVLLCFQSCTIQDDKVTVIVPSGTPTLGLSGALYQNQETLDYQIVQGSDALVGAFTNQNYDIIVAPVNLGAKLYHSLQEMNYVFYQTIVGGCFYLVSSVPLASLNDLNQKEITVFGANSTPDVMIRSLISYYQLDVQIHYVSDVTAANAMLMSGKASIIVSAEPSISKMNASNQFHVLNLQEEWKKMAGNSFAIPQAGIFVKKSLYQSNRVQKVLEDFNQSLQLADTNPESLAQFGVRVDPTLEKLGVSVLTRAIPQCHFLSKPLEKQEIEFYFNQLIALNLGATIGGKLPDEKFYA